MAPDKLSVLFLLTKFALPPLALYAYFRERGHTLAEAAAYGLGIPLMALSGMGQLAAMAGLSSWIWGLEILYVLWAGILLGRAGRRLIPLGRELFHFGQTHPTAVLSLSLGCLWLGIQAMVGPHTFYNPWQGSSIFESLMQGRPVPELIKGGLGPDNAQWVAFMNFRIDTPMGAGLSSFQAYLAIGFATYALARRYAWPPTAITTTLLVMSMPRLVALAPSGRFEIIQAAGAMLSLLAVYRVVERPVARDLVVLAGAIPFTMGGRGVALALPAILGGLSLILILRRHDYRTIPSALKSHPYHLLLALALLTIFTQLPYAAIQEHWINIPLNRDGLQGSLANLGRYFLESLHFTQPLEKLWLSISGDSPRLLLEGIHRRFVSGPFGPVGAAGDFRICWSPTLPHAWFGPLSCIMVLPGIVYALLKGPRRLKAVAVSLLAYLYLITLIPAWQPGNADLFTPFFAMGGFCTAYFLPPWRFTRRRRILLQLICALLLGYACRANFDPQWAEMVAPLSGILPVSLHS